MRGVSHRRPGKPFSRKPSAFPIHFMRCSAVIQSVRTSYTHTIYACYLGYITQAIVNNFAPLLFLTFSDAFDLALGQIAMISTLNFAIQLCVDLLSAKIIDRVGYRASVLAAHGFAAAGLIGLAVFPALLDNPFAGLLAAVALYAIGGGVIEVLISPIVEACPTKKKEAAMSLLHSFYCWGHLAVVLLSTAFFAAFGVARWPVLACLWAVVPLLNLVYFTQVPIYPIAAGQEKLPLGGLLRQKTFWFVIVLMICAGASEQGMSQWASAFAESALHLSKTAGDLAGPCSFALCMGTARALYGRFSDRIPLKRAMAVCAALCAGCYTLAAFAPHPLLGLAGCAACGFSVGVFWPGTFSLAAKALPAGGTAMYALMALAGDLGCSSGPGLVGKAANAAGGNLKAGILAAAAFPLLMLAGLAVLSKQDTENR